MTGLGIGIIGCGVISDIYMQNAAIFPQLSLRAVADLVPEAAQAKADAHGVAAMTPAELLARDDIDIVLNLTIPAAHVEVGLAALDAGKHVYSEKPLAGSVREARQLVLAAAEKGLRIGCAPDTFLGGAHQTARALLDSGRIGRATAGSATLMLPGHERWHPNPDFYYAGPGAGPLFDMGPYYITAMLNLLGPVRRVSALASRGRDHRIIAQGPRAGESVPVEAATHVAGVMEFANGALVQIVTSFDVRAHRHSPLELYGTDGSLLIPDPNRFDGDVELFDGEWCVQDMNHAHGDGNYRGLGLADMAAAITEGRPHRANGELALHALDVIESLLASADSGKAVTLSTSCERPEALAPSDRFGQIDFSEAR
ncbi:Gfo/Idh/MocA family protein [Paracoccus methylarcula]|uniref:Gfo/Idh/MocA family oxidoreductase n=1 Tax=Paracoccus methylarcula TaxID=72022 RepID=A0A422R0B7_9RHOB|nr:Gfo/Idh/MocA family oxidoreductase [Paracoccus methylarcula]RNF35687.1 gfo/Idh/MocA family oxidoreductase [Paracoccus methylarcula]